MADGDTIALNEKIYIETCCDVAAFGLIFYEYAITLDREITLVWRRKFTAATAVFLANRYVALLKYPIVVVGLGVLSDKSCARINVLAMTLEIIPYLIWVVFSTLRIYAICGHYWRYALPVLVTGSMPLATNIYLYSQTQTANYPLPVGCIWLDGNISEELYYSLLVATRTSAILSDVLVLVLTWWRTYSSRKAAAQANVKVSLASLLLRDGTIYFLIILTLNVFHMAFTLTSTFSYSITFEELFTTILISRFLLNIRQADDARRHADSTMSQISFVQWPADPRASAAHPSFIEPFGAPLDHGLLMSPTDSTEPTSAVECLSSTGTLGHAHVCNVDQLAESSLFESTNHGRCDCSSLLRSPSNIEAATLGSF